jgi:hypothetical protein
MNDSQKPLSLFGGELNRFIACIEGLRETITPLMLTADLAHRWASYRFNQFLEKHGELTESTESHHSYKIGPDGFRPMQKHLNNVQSTNIACRVLPNSLLVAIVSQFDAYLGRIIRAMILTKPDLLNSSEKTISGSQLLSFDTIDAAKEYLIEKEIESVLRKSHTDHFLWLESRLGIPFRKDLPSWGRFIEITERRNLFVHCDGVVSHQYLTVCQENQSPLPEEIKAGDRLCVQQQYYKEACDCIAEIGVKLGNVIWRKLASHEMNDADNNLNEIGFQLIIKENYRLASVIFDFAANVLKKHSSERSKFTFLVNLAQAHKWLGDQDRCRKMLDQTDWTAKGDDFKIAVHALRDEFGELCTLMKRLGSTGPIASADYKSWPIFKECRIRSDFCEAYQTVFQEPLEKIEEAIPVNIEDISAFLRDIIGKEQEEEGKDTSATSQTTEKKKPKKPKYRVGEDMAKAKKPKSPRMPVADLERNEQPE